MNDEKCYAETTSINFTYCNGINCPNYPCKSIQMFDLKPKTAVNFDKLEQSIREKYPHQR